MSGLNFEVTTYKVIRGPRWWQLRTQFWLWREGRRNARWRRDNPEAAEMADDLRRTIERQIMFGPEGSA